MIPHTRDIHLSRVSAPPLFVEDDANICNHTTTSSHTPPPPHTHTSSPHKHSLSLFLSLFSLSLPFIETQAASGSRGKLRAASGSELKGVAKGERNTLDFFFFSFFFLRITRKQHMVLV